MQRSKQVRVVTGLRVIDPLTSPIQPIRILYLNFFWDVEVVSGFIIGKFELSDVAELQIILVTEIGDQKVPAIDFEPLADPTEAFWFFYPRCKVPQNIVCYRLEVRW